MTRKGVFLLLLSLLFWGSALANTRAERVVRQADHLFAQLAYREALGRYHEAAELGAMNEHVCRRLGHCYLKLGDPQHAEPWLAQVVKYLGRTPEDLLAYVDVLKALGRYDEAEQWFKEYAHDTSLEDPHGEATRRAGLRQLLSMSTRFELFDPGINTGDDEFAPAWVGNGRIMYSAAREHWGWFKYTDGWTGDPFTEMMVADRSGAGKLQDPRPMGGAMNSTHNDGPGVCDGHTRDIYYTTNLYRTASKRWELGIVRARSVGHDTWRPEGPVWEEDFPFPAFHPALSADGRTMVFASDRPGGTGGSDLYVSQLKDAKWQLPEPIGSNINTDRDELFPFIATDGKLFFSSNGHLGIGGLDVFMCLPLASGGYGAPINVGLPVNSTRDDLGFIIDAVGRNGYFASNRTGGRGGDDIYGFQMVGEIAPLPYQCVGTVIDEVHGAGRHGVNVDLCDATGRLLNSTSSDNDGSFAFQLEQGKEYFLRASMDGRITDTQWLLANDLGMERTVVRDLHLLPNEGAWVRGAVRLTDLGQHTDNAEVTLVDLGNMTSRNITLEAGGYFQTRVAPGEPLELYLSKPGYWTTSIPFTADSSARDLRSDRRLALAPLLPGKLLPLVESPEDAASTGQVHVQELAHRMHLNPEVAITITTFPDVSPGHGTSEVAAKAFKALLLSDNVAARRITLDVRPGPCPVHGEGHGTVMHSDCVLFSVVPSEEGASNGN